MKLVEIEYRGRRSAAVVTERGYVALDILNAEKRTDWPTELSRLAASGDAARLCAWYAAGGKMILENMSRTLIVKRGEARETGDVLEIKTDRAF